MRNGFRFFWRRLNVSERQQLLVVAVANRIQNLNVGRTENDTNIRRQRNIRLHDSQALLGRAAFLRVKPLVDDNGNIDVDSGDVFAGHRIG